MSQFLVRFLSVFLVTSGHVHGSRESTIRRLRPLSVPVGKSAFIQPDDVILSRGQNTTSCVVEVADDDAATLLRVGTATPRVGYNVQHSDKTLLFSKVRANVGTFCSF